MNLNTKQMQVVNAPVTGPAVCIALAGTGKTTVLLARAKHLVEQRLANNVEPSILMVAFSKDVANTLGARLDPSISKYVTIKTSHALAYQELKKSHEKLGIPESFNIQKRSLIKYQFKSWIKNQGTSLGNLGVDDLAIEICLYGLDDCLAKNISFTQTRAYKQSSNRNISIIYGLLEQFRYSSGNLLFGDLLSLANKLPETDLTKYTDVMIDEAQDLNANQFTLLSKYAKQATSNLWMMDPNQCIFGFQGADPAIVARIKEYFPETLEYVLSDNYRCAPEIIDVANKILTTEVGTNLQLIATQNTGGTIHKYTEPVGLTDWISYMLECGYNYKDIVVLFRFKRELVELETAMFTAGIPFESSGEGFFESEIVQNFIATLELKFLSPNFENFTQVTQMLGIEASDANTLWTRYNNNLVGNLSTLRYDRLQAEFGKVGAAKIHKLKDLVNVSSLESLANSVASYSTGYYTKLFLPHIHKENTDVCKALIDWIIKNRTTTVGAVLLDIKDKLRARPDGSKGVRLLTMHSAKGREWPCVGLWNVRAHNQQMCKTSTDSWTYDPSEENRLLYVAATRAQREMCVISNDPNSIVKHITNPLETLTKEIFGE